MKVKTTHVYEVKFYNSGELRLFTSHKRPIEGIMCSIVTFDDPDFVRVVLKGMKNEKTHERMSFIVSETDMDYQLSRNVQYLMKRHDIELPHVSERKEG